MINEHQAGETAYWSAKDEIGRGRLVRNQLGRGKAPQNGTQIRKLTPQCAKASTKHASGEVEQFQSLSEDFEHGKGLAAKKDPQSIWRGEVGAGIVNLSEGWTYKGEYSSGVFHGYGELYQDNRVIYRGSFQYGYFHGHGYLRNCPKLAFLVRWPGVEELLTRKGLDKEKEEGWEWYSGEFKEGEVNGYGQLRLGSVTVIGEWTKGSVLGKAIIKSEK